MRHRSALANQIEIIRLLPIASKSKSALSPILSSPVSDHQNNLYIIIYWF